MEDLVSAMDKKPGYSYFYIKVLSDTPWNMPPRPGPMPSPKLSWRVEIFYKPE